MILSYNKVSIQLVPTLLRYNKLSTLWDPGNYLTYNKESTQLDPKHIKVH